MRFARQKFLKRVIAVAIIVLSGHGVLSQATRTIKIVVPVSPGGVLDTLARLLGEQIRHAQGQTVIVENRSGAGGMIAAEAVSRAAPDGYTLMMASPDFLTSSRLRKLDYDLRFEPVCYLVSVPNVIVVNGASSYWTLADLLNAARGKPGELTLASVGPASSLQIAFEKLKRAANVEMTFVSYPGAAPAINALLGEHVTGVVFHRSRAIEFGQAARSSCNYNDSDSAPAGRADRCRVRLQRISVRLLARAFCTAENVEGNDFPPCCLVHCSSTSI
jgi:tripartite-type tricarboxylate transporter receptor subunit TctC